MHAVPEEGEEGSRLIHSALLGELPSLPPDDALPHAFQVLVRSNCHCSFHQVFRFGPPAHIAHCGCARRHQRHVVAFLQEVRLIQRGLRVLLVAKDAAQHRRSADQGTIGRVEVVSGGGVRPASLSKGVDCPAQQLLGSPGLTQGSGEPSSVQQLNWIPDLLILNCQAICQSGIQPPNERIESDKSTVPMPSGFAANVGDSVELL